MTLAIISSLYRCEAHLPQFTAALFGMAKRLSQAGIAARFLPIVNDATRDERQRIDRLAQEINSGYFGAMMPQYVARESLYASWNRGLYATDAQFFAPWNADDIRSGEALIEGYHALQAGAELVDFAYIQVMRGKRWGILPVERRSQFPCKFDPRQFTRRNGLGPFFMASRSLVERVGAFDAGFRVAGDMEWASRLQKHARFQPGRALGGSFVIHGGNLSNTGSQTEDIEVNIIYLRRGEWGQLRPADPRGLREAWESWGNRGGISLPGQVTEYLWGAGAEHRWRRYRRERRQPPQLRRLRLALASRGWLHSEEWAASRRRLER